MTIPGKNLLVYIPGDGQFGEVGQLYPIGCDRQCSLQIQTDFIETTVEDNGFWRTYLPQFIGYQVSGDNLANYCEIMSEHAVFTYLSQRKPVVFKFIANAHTPDEGYVMKTGTGYFETLQINGDASGSMSWAYTLRGTGKLEEDYSFTCNTGGGGEPTPPIEDIMQVYRKQFIATDGQTTYQSDDLIGATLLWLSIQSQDLYVGNGDYQMAGLNSTTGVLTWNYETANGNEVIALYKK